MAAEKVEQHVEEHVEESRRPSLIGAIIAALDDRNLAAALRVLDPAGERGAAGLGPQGSTQAAGCARCVTRGE